MERDAAATCYTEMKISICLAAACDEREESKVLGFDRISLNFGEIRPFR
jgi:hypothetical protein